MALITSKVREVRGSGPDEAVLRYVLLTEEHIRRRAIELCTGPPQAPWGRALRIATQDEAYRWTESRDTLLWPQRKMPTTVAPEVFPVRDAQNERRRGSSRGRVCTATVSSRGL